MQPETEAGSVECLPYCEFGPSVVPTNAGHHPASSFSADDIRHSAQSYVDGEMT
jgi:hypothetical protein